ncbi:hypothetical protein EC968_010218 [Mortierella alpina]|nr:hypothetical protein EC968_010218 [Mortierella alpina]
MSDQAEILRKRREARQKKILASGESRLSKITGTAGTNAQVTPSPAVLLAREQLLKKDQEEERLKALQAAGGNIRDDGMGADKQSNADESNQPHEGRTPTLQVHKDGEEKTPLPSSPSQSATTATRIRSPSTSSTTNSTAHVGASKTPTVQDLHDADPDDSLGAPPAHVSTASPSSGANQQNPFTNNPFLSPQHHQALTRMMQEEGGSAEGSNLSMKQQPQQQSGFPPGFTVITPQVDESARWWKLLHFVLSVLFGFLIVYREYSQQGDLGRFEGLAKEKPLPYGAYSVAPMPVFWYFVTMELILQSTRMALHGVTASPSSMLGTIAGFLPPPFSDAIRVFMRYRLIWSSLVNDMSVIVFIVGLTIVFSHMFS